MVIQRAVFPQFLGFNVFSFSDIVKDGVETLVTGGVGINSRGAPLKPQMRKDMVPQTRTGPGSLEIADRIRKAAVKLPFDAVSRRHALIETTTWLGPSHQ